MKLSCFRCVTVDKYSGSRKSLLSPRFPALLALSALVFAAAPASARKPTYTLTVTEDTNKKTGDFTSTQTLSEKRTGRVIWVRHFPSADHITWSKNRRAVAFETVPTKSERPQHQFDIKLVVWKTGFLVQSFFPQPFIHADYVENMLWSPDTKHLLMRVGSSGASDIDRGCYYCLNADTKRVVGVGSGSLRVQWLGNKQIMYWPIGESNGRAGSFYESSKPRLWRVPKGF